MNEFPQFMKNAINKIARTSQNTEDVEGYLFDGRDGCQAAFWTCSADRKSSEHAHEYDEYMVVVQGRYTLIIDGEKIPLTSGQECLIAKGVAHSGECVAGTRTIHVFGGKRVEREKDNDHLSGHHQG